MATDQSLMCPPQARGDAQEILARDRTRGSDHEQSRHRDHERNPIDLAVKCNADHAHTAAANVDQTRRTSCELICVRGATLPDVPTRIGKTIMGRREGLFDNLYDGPVTCVGVWAWQHFGNSSQKSPSVKGARVQLPRPRHHRAEASWPIDQVRFSGTVRTLWRLGGDGRLQMNSKWTKLAAAGALS